MIFGNFFINKRIFGNYWYWNTWEYYYW